MASVQRVSEDEFSKAVAQFVNVSNRPLGAKVLATSDEWFAEASNLITPGPPKYEVRFVPTGRWYDGWETRRHNPEPSDWTLIELGVSSSTVAAVEVDTTYFSGNHAPAISVEACYIEPGQKITSETKFDEVVSKTECGPSQRHFFVRTEGPTQRGYSHVKLHMYPDGGIARFRVYGTPLPVFPAVKSDIIDMAAVANGGVSIACSDQHFSSADNLLLPGRGIDMSDGWETSRSREPGHVDWAIVKLGAPTIVHQIVVDTAFFRGNYPQSVRIDGIAAESNDAAVSANESLWGPLVPKSKTGPDVEHYYDVTVREPITHVRLVMIPDGGVKRLRVLGQRA